MNLSSLLQICIANWARLKNSPLRLANNPEVNICKNEVIIALHFTSLLISRNNKCTSHSPSWPSPGSEVSLKPILLKYRKYTGTANGINKITL